MARDGAIPSPCLPRLVGSCERGCGRWSALPSFVRDVLLNPETRYKGDNEEAMYLATSIMAAGGDNTRMTLNTFVIVIICYPAAFERARAEIDEICGHLDHGVALRLPEMTDMESMPYMCAMVKEVLRWTCTVPIIPPHQLTEDFEYEGYRFPTGTEFLINNQALCSDCTEPGHFLPERWLNGNEGNVIHGFWGFGGGRRVCVGYKVAQQALFIAFSHLIQCFNFAAGGPLDSHKLNHCTLGEPCAVTVGIRGVAYRALIVGEASRVGLL